MGDERPDIGINKNSDNQPDSDISNGKLPQAPGLSSNSGFLYSLESPRQ